MPRNYQKGVRGVVTEDHSGCRFGMWTALHLGERKCGRTTWVCRCDCGAEKPVMTSHLVSGASTGCGCTRSERSRNAKRTHGMTDTTEYAIWCRMIGRCENASGPDYARYGGRGISVCKEWRENFLAFYRDMGPRPGKEFSVDRIDVNGNYEPGNCRWATWKQQGRNTRRNRWVVYQGERITLAEACERSGVNYGTAKWRLYNGRSDQEAFKK